MRGHTPRQTRSGVEELSLVEFPLALLAKRAPKGVKTLRSVDEITDSSTGERVQREVLVTGSDAYGLPLGPDMDVLLALMALTQERHGFAERTVEFSLYQLREYLRWPHEHGEYNKRLKTSLLRWLGATVEFTNSMRRNGRWLSTEGFHLIDNVRLSNTVRMFDPDSPQVFRWNDVVVEGMQASNSKRLDWDFYVGLESAISKRLYRLLDKRFANQSHWSYDLVPFCRNKLGFCGESYRPSDFKKKLRPAIRELEEKGVLASRSPEKRFESKNGIPRIWFSRPRRSGVTATAATATRSQHDLDPLAKELVARGVTPVTAVKLAQSEPTEAQQQVEYYDFKIAKGWKPERSGGGYLNIAIRDRYAAPEGFLSKADRDAQRAAAEALRAAQAQAKEKEERQRQQQQQAIDNKLRDYLAGLPNPNEFKTRALENASPFARDQYRRASKSGDGGDYLDVILREQMERDCGS